MAPNRPAWITKYVDAPPHAVPDPRAVQGARANAELYGIETLQPPPFVTVFIGAMFVVDQDGRSRLHRS